MPDGEYYVQVTEPNNALLGTSIGRPEGEKPVVVVDGEFVIPYQLWDIVVKASDQTKGYDDTTNAGGEYKVWVSTQADFKNSTTKTDNFKVQEGGGGGEELDGTLQVDKFYDTDTDGILDEDELLLNDWLVRITDANGGFVVLPTPVSITLPAGEYLVEELDPNETNWVATTDKSFVISVVDEETTSVLFGNVALGAGGGHTLGFWSNKNGKALVDSADLEALRDLNLVKADNSEFQPLTYDELKSWLLDGNAVNMRYMLSVQLAAMVLNVRNGFVDSGALVYVDPDFVTISELIDAANVALADNTKTRDELESLKDALDDANNNLTFVLVPPPVPPYTFGP